jgi:cytochrome c biogenesis protein CcmG/thiol:disulfide interchange protein DsbE
MMTHDHDSAPAGPVPAGPVPADPVPAEPPEAGLTGTPLRRLRTMSRPAKIGTAGAVLVLAVAIALVLAAARGPAPQAGQLPTAKGFSLPELTEPGSTMSLADYAGRPVIVNFFASWCGPCQRETPLLARYYASHGGRVIILGIDANDERPAALRFVAAKGVRYPVGSDPFPASVTTSYGVLALPQTFFLNAQHRIVARVMGAVTAGELARDVALMTQQTSQNRG